MLLLKQAHKSSRLYSASATLVGKMAGATQIKIKKKQPPVAKTTTEEDYYYKGITALGKQYGPIFRLDMGSM